MNYLKKPLVLLIILLSISKMYGQYSLSMDYFISNDFSEILNINNYSTTTSYDFYNSEPKIFNVHFYGLETTDGEYPSSLDENYALQQIAALNIAFNPYNIFFKYRGYDHYSEIYNGSELINESHRTIMNRMYEVAQIDGNDNSINIVLHHTVCTNDKGSADIYKKIISLRYCTSHSRNVIFQMGHIFGLLKSYRGTDGHDSSYAITLPYPACEQVYEND